MSFRRIALCSVAVLASSACRSEPPPANVTLPSATISATASATSVAPPPSASAPPAALSLQLEAAMVPAPAAKPGSDAAAIELTLVNPTAVSIRCAWYRPLMYGIDAMDAAGARVSVVIPAIDIPVSREELVLAPGERKKLPNVVTLWFDPTNKKTPSMFDWVVVSKRTPLVLTIRLSVDVGDAGQTTLTTTVRT